MLFFKKNNLRIEDEIEQIVQKMLNRPAKDLEKFVKKINNKKNSPTMKDLAILSRLMEVVNVPIEEKKNVRIRKKKKSS